MHSEHNAQSVFISHSARDSSRIGEVIRTLKAQGIMSDEDNILEPPATSASGSIRGALKDAIDSASKVVVLWSTDSANSQFVNYEVGMAEALNKPIIMAVLEGALSSMPANLRTNPVVQISN